MAYPPILQRLLDLLARINAVLQEESDAEPIVTLSKWDETFLCQVPLPFLVNEAPAGWVPATGAVIEGAADRFPKAWARLQQSDMQHLLCSEEDWQTASTQVYYTDAAGNEYSWDGVGGVCKYVQNLDTGTLRMMDLRGLHQEAAGYNSLAVGGTVFAGLPGITGMAAGWQACVGGAFTGAFSGSTTPQSGSKSHGSVLMYDMAVRLDASISSPIYGGSPTVQPRSYGVLPCVYLGS